METYLVGGAVRDKLLGYPVHERDWVVVGATPDEMLAAGFRPVGRDFPVFLHPETHEEYALARTERKQGHGYHGFVCHSSPDVTLEEDLRRRDLTINAMAESAGGDVIDPYGGQTDLSACLLRHVSEAFQEDPLRILRTARFAARYHHLGFRVAAETEQLMTAMVEAGEVDFLVAERTWKETERALAERNPTIFFEVLRRCGAMARLMPELVTAPAASWRHLDAAAQMGLDTAQRFAALAAELPATAVQSLGDRLKAPNEFRELAALTASYHLPLLQAHDAASIAKVLKATDALRRPERLDQLLAVAEVLGLPPARRRLLLTAAQAAAAVRAADLSHRGLSGPALGAALQQQRLEAIAAVLEAKQ